VNAPGYLALAPSGVAVKFLGVTFKPIAKYFRVELISYIE
jgi:hypothetical protein